LTGACAGRPAGTSNSGKRWSANLIVEATLAFGGAAVGVPRLGGALKAKRMAAALKSDLGCVRRLRTGPGTEGYAVVANAPGLSRLRRSHSAHDRGWPRLTPASSTIRSADQRSCSGSVEFLSRY
jgi:hypothetical protein